MSNGNGNAMANGNFWSQNPFKKIFQGYFYPPTLPMQKKSGQKGPYKSGL